MTGTTLLPQSVAEAATSTPSSGCIDSSLAGVLDRLGIRLGNCADGQPDPVARPGGGSVPPECGPPDPGSPDDAAAAAPPPPVGVAGILANLLPGQLLDLSGWKLTLPTGEKGKPVEIAAPALAAFTDDFFRLNEARNGVVFRANAGGVTTSGSHYPRSELREMNGSDKAEWDSADGTHTLDVCEAITKTPAAKPEVVSAQIHDTQDDVLQIRLEGSTLSAQWDDGRGRTVLDPAYRLGTPFRTKIVVTADGIAVSYNGEHKADIQKSGTGWYWKVGAYVQSNQSKGDSPDAIGEVVVYSLDRTAS